MPRIAWVEDAEANGELAETVAQVRVFFGVPMPDVVRTMSLRPDFLAAIMQAMKSLNLNDGALTSVQREMIGCYVAALNRCQYCEVVHAGALSAFGGGYEDAAAALRRRDLDGAPISAAERLLLRLVETLTLHSYRITDDQVQGLRDVGWTDAQIAEAVYTGALMNLLVRLADAFGLEPPTQLDWTAPSAAQVHTPSCRLGRPRPRRKE